MHGVVRKETEEAPLLDRLTEPAAGTLSRKVRPIHAKHFAETRRSMAKASREKSLASEEVALAPVLRCAGPRARGDAWFDRIVISRLLGRTFPGSRCGSAPSDWRSVKALSGVIRQ